MSDFCRPKILDGRTLPRTLPEDAAIAAAPLSRAWASMSDTVREACPQCGAAHDAVWTVRRVIADTLGPWNVFRVNGAGITLPGGGLPATVATLPRDAVRLAPEAMAAFWHAD